MEQRSRHSTSRTCQIHQVHDARLLVLAAVALGELIEDDGDYGVRSTARRVHVRRRHGA